MNSTQVQNMQISFSVNPVNYDENKIKSKTYKTSEGTYYNILNYDKDILCNDDIMNGHYRSVVLDPDTNNVLSFALPKSIPIDSFKERFPKVDQDNIYVNEIVEGTMINLFWDTRLDRWELATKSAVGGNYWFFRTHYDVSDMQQQEQLTFRQMFIEACGEDSSICLNDVVILQSLPKNFIIPEHISLSNMFKTIGNGVPYLAAKGLAETIRVFIDKDRKSVV
jgi:site-specific DNA-cytosine methylase